MEPALVDARGLYRFFHNGDEETVALRGASLRVAAGEIVAIEGPSGSGKTTLLQCLAGLDDPDGGVVRIAGELMAHRTEPVRTELRMRSIGLLFQHNNLFEHLSVAENVHLVRQLAGARTGTDVIRSLGLDARRQARPSELSGGEAARAGLAVALANDPAVVLADEPTGELDQMTAATVLDLLIARAREGSAVIVVTHDPDLSRAADRVVYLRDGYCE